MIIDKDNIKILLIILVLGLGLGYAYINSDLNINGTAQVNSANWDVHWANIQVDSGSVSGTNVVTAPTISNSTTVNYSIILDKPGDYYEFTVDAVNGGAIDAMIDTIDSKLNGATITTLPDYLNYTVTYSSGTPLEPNHELKANTTEKYKVRIEYNMDIELNQIPATNQTLSLQFTVTYRQATENAVPVSHTVTSMINACLEANCVYIVPPDDEDLWTIWNTRNETPTVFEETDYYTNYQDAINASEHGAFIGITLNNKRADRIFACYAYNDIPLCIEGTADGSKFETNKAAMLQTEEFWNASCRMVSTTYMCNISEYSSIDNYSHGSVEFMGERVTVADDDGRFGIYTS